MAHGDSFDDRNDGKLHLQHDGYFLCRNAWQNRAYRVGGNCILLYLHDTGQIGKKNIGEAEKMASIGFTLAIAVGAVIFILGTIFLRPLAVLLGAGISKELMKATISYLRITLISVPFLLAANVLYNVLRLQGSARDSMIGMLAGMLLNIILDPVFILGLHMGVAGAALASLIGQICGFLLLLQRTGRGGNVSVNFGRYKPDLVHVKEIIAGGAPNFCRQGITSISGGSGSLRWGTRL